MYELRFRTPGSLEAGHKSLAETLTTLIQNGQKIEAIKQYRERTRSGLKEAKDAIERLAWRAVALATSHLNHRRSGRCVTCSGGKKFAAIKLYREKTGVGLVRRR